MPEPGIVFCAVAYSSFLNFVGYFADTTRYRGERDSLAYLVEEAGDLADALALCQGYAREIAFLEKIGREYARQLHAIEAKGPHE